jgi:hypothetical protein
VRDDSLNQPSEHEQQVAQEERERGGEPDTQPSRSAYDREVEADKEGTTADQLKERGDDSDAPLDAAYRPKTG